MAIKLSVMKNIANKLKKYLRIKLFINKYTTYTMSNKCNFCNEKMGIKNYNSHLTECVLNHSLNKSGYLIEFTSHSQITNKIYKIYGIFGVDCKFSDIDVFLKNIWCNDNLYESSFQTYVVNKSPKVVEFIENHFNILELMEKIHEYQLSSVNNSMEKIDIDMDDKISKRIRTKKFIVVSGAKKESKFQFEYTFNVNNQTKNIDEQSENIEAYFTILKKLNGTNKNNNVELVYQNEPFINLKCLCKKKATCIFEYYLFCDECSKNIYLEEPIPNSKKNKKKKITQKEKFLTITNSPLVGLKSFN